MTVAPESFYSPGRLKLLLWRYDDLVRLVGNSASPETPTQHLPRETPEGGFEAGAAVKADLDTAMLLLDPISRRIVHDYYIAGFAAVEIAAHLRHVGVNRWFVDRARHRALRQMALSLHWIPRKGGPDAVLSIDLDDDTGLGSAELRERMTMVVHRAFSRCPKFGPKGYRCPVLDCDGRFNLETGRHVGDVFDDEDEVA